MSEENLFETLTDSEKGVLISAANSFKSTIVELFGDEYAEEVFNKVSDIILPSLKYEMLKNALTHKYDLFVIVEGINPSYVRSTRFVGSSFNYEKVPSIKAIRTYSKDRLGLKESKDICDAAEQGIKTKLAVESVEIRNTLVSELRNFGMIVS
jgi:hypothetical protein